MSNFDYNRHTVVGELSINSNSGHGYVKVYGYMNGYTFIATLPNPYPFSTSLSALCVSFRYL